VSGVPVSGATRKETRSGPGFGAQWQPAIRPTRILPADPKRLSYRDETLENRAETGKPAQETGTKWQGRPATTGFGAAMTKGSQRGDGDDTGNLVVTRTRTVAKRPNLYRVLLLNDDYTPMEFVVHVVERFFQKNREEATRIMLHVHHHGVGECGVYTYEVAETKVTQVMDFARKHQHPLQCVMEKK
jgi:ATP-dependent Clp protease adaptor protein ClpS